MKKETPAILVIDAEADFIQKNAATLGAQHGVQFRVVSNGKEGLASAQSQPPAAILLSVELPGMSGYSICARLKKDDILKSVPVIITSANKATQDDFANHQQKHTRADAYLCKPFDSDELLETLSAFIPAIAVPARAQAQTQPRVASAQSSDRVTSDVVHSQDMAATLAPRDETDIDALRKKLSQAEHKILDLKSKLYKAARDLLDQREKEMVHERRAVEAEEEGAHFKTKLGQLEVLHQQSTERLKHLETELSHRSQALLHAEKQSKERADALQSTQKQQTEALRQLTEAKAQLTEARAQVTDTKAQLAEAKNQIVQLTDRSSSQEASIIALQSTVKKSQRIETEQRAEIDRAHKELVQEKQISTNLSQQLENTRSQAAQSQKDLTQQLESTRTQAAQSQKDLTQQLESTRAQAAQSQKDLHQAQERIAKLEDQLYSSNIRHERELADREILLKQEQQRRSEMDAVLKAEKAAHEALRKEHEALKNGHETLKKEQSQVLHQLSELEKLQHTQAQTLAAKEQDLALHRNRLDETRTEISALKMKVQTVEKSQNETAQERDALLRAKKELEQNIDAERMETTRAKDEIRQTELKLQATQTLVQSAQSEARITKKQLSDLHERVQRVTQILQLGHSDALDLNEPTDAGTASGRS